MKRLFSWHMYKWLGVAWGCVILLSACAGPKVETECQTVKIVAVVHSEETGQPDWYTIVEFPDATRRFRFNRYGEIGDTFCARKHDQTRWR